jgi:rhodanese-related sulfurtransferase
MIEDLDRETVKSGLADGSLLIVDVREPHEFAAGHIPGSVSMPLSAFNPGDLPMEAGKRVVLSCAAGMRSLQAAMLALQAGVRVDAHYRGGFKDWLFAGEKVETL